MASMAEMHYQQIGYIIHLQKHLKIAFNERIMFYLPRMHIPEKRSPRIKKTAVSNRSFMVSIKVIKDFRD
ncbi:MAG: hypothetical protein JWP81_990 [Ferruginibacter sp.]|nr:hypothetical protein [Ferruginibacter sp.]